MPEQSTRCIELTPLIVDATHLIDCSRFESGARVDAARELQCTSRILHRIGVLLGAKDASTHPDESGRVVGINLECPAVVASSQARVTSRIKLVGANRELLGIHRGQLGLNHGVAWGLIGLRRSGLTRRRYTNSSRRRGGCLSRRDRRSHPTDSCARLRRLRLLRRADLGGHGLFELRDLDGDGFFNLLRRGNRRWFFDLLSPLRSDGFLDKSRRRRRGEATWRRSRFTWRGDQHDACDQEREPQKGEGAEQDLAWCQSLLCLSLSHLRKGDQVVFRLRPQVIERRLPLGRLDLERSGLGEQELCLVVFTPLRQELAEPLEGSRVLWDKPSCPLQRLLGTQRVAIRPPGSGTKQQVLGIVHELSMVSAQEIERRTRFAARDQIACDLQRMRLPGGIQVVERVGVEAEIRHGRDPIRVAAESMNSRQSQSQLGPSAPKLVYSRAMFVVACSGFPVPVSRYWQEFDAVEISDTEIAIPGAGTVRRWIREAPDGFLFTVVAPSSVSDSGFRRTKENKATCEEVAALAEDLTAKAVVFHADEKFKHGKANRAALRAFLGFLPSNMPPVVFDFEAWKPSDIAAACGDRPAVAAYDPLTDDPPPKSKMTYLRLPGPAGHRSRYDEASVAKIAEHCNSLDPELGICVFRNIDMQTNAHQLIKRLE